MIRRAGLLFAALVTLSACGSNDTTVDVFAAASLTDAFTEFETRFEAANPGVDVRLNLAGSDTLRRQIDDGATVDVFAPADESIFAGLTADGSAVLPVPYASNQIEMVAHPDSVDLDWSDPDVIVARCDVGVPCGIATDVLLGEVGLDVATFTTESNVRAVLTKVRLGEADAGFVYTTDLLSAGDEVVALGITSPSATVRLAVAAMSDQPEARAFAEFVASEEAAAVLRGLGFASP